MRSDQRLRAVQAACERVRAADPDDEASYMAIADNLDRTAADVWAEPATSWADVVARAEIAAEYADKDEAGAVVATSDAAQDRAYAELVRAVLAVAKKYGCLH